MISVQLVAMPALFRDAVAAAIGEERDMRVLTGGDPETAGDPVTAGDTPETAGDTPKPATAPRADVAVVDLDGPGLSVLGRVAALPGCPIVALTAHPTRAPSRGRGRAGGLVGKDRGLNQLIAVVRRVAAGERVVEPPGAVVAPSRRGAVLTQREIDVLRLAAEGLAPEDIAGGLQLTLGTVRGYLSAIVRKSGARTRLEAIQVAARSGWL